MTATATVDLTVIRTRGEERLHCPLCSQAGSLHRIGGGASASTYRCEAYRYDPNRGNACRFTFTVTDAMLWRLAER